MATDKLKPRVLKSNINVPHVNPEPAGSPTGISLPSYNPARYKGGMGTRFAFYLPGESRGPIRARETRRQKGKL